MKRAGGKGGLSAGGKTGRNISVNNLKGECGKRGGIQSPSKGSRNFARGYLKGGRKRISIASGKKGAKT